MSDFRIAVLGLGSIGLRHARNARALGLQVVGFDPDGERRNLAQAQGCHVADTPEAALDGAMAAVVASPNSLHKADIERCVAAGIHALVEKPLASSVDGMDAVLAAAETRNLILAGAFNLRFRAVVVAARALLEAGSVGNLIWGRFLSASWLPDWRPHQDHRRGYTNDARTGGVILDAIHEIDLANHLLGPAEVTAASARKTGLLDLVCEDLADIVVRHAGGAQSTIHLDYVTRPRRRRFEICGTEGMLMVDLRSGEIELRNHADEIALREVHHVGFDREYELEMADFIDAVRQGRPPACGAREALAVLAQAVAARRLCGLPE